jgi:site-specific DNA-cytosine methylase
MSKKPYAFAKRTSRVLSFIFFAVFLISSRGISHIKIMAPKISGAHAAYMRMYETMELAKIGLSREAYEIAIKGFERLRSAGILYNERILSIVDFSLPSNRKRLFVIDNVTGKLLYNTFVSHGRNSGAALATKFSNQFNSFQSSLGFYVTGQTYRGHHGYSLRLQGMEQGINDNAFSRGIVMHAAKYVNENTARQNGYIGRSEGCPAIPVNIHRSIIEAIKNGTCLFVYGSDKEYLNQSKYLQGPNEAS